MEGCQISRTIANCRAILHSLLHNLSPAPFSPQLLHYCFPRFLAWTNPFVSASLPMSAEGLFAAVAANATFDLVQWHDENDELDVNTVDEQGWTALHHAADGGNCQIAALLIEWEADLSAVRLCLLSRTASRW